MATLSHTFTISIGADVMKAFAAGVDAKVLGMAAGLDDQIDAAAHCFSCVPYTARDFTLGDPLNFDTPERHTPSPIDDWFDDCTNE